MRNIHYFVRADVKEMRKFMFEVMIANDVDERASLVLLLKHLLLIQLF
jgi:hypothetical protein